MKNGFVVNRRDFLKISGLGLGSLALGFLSADEVYYLDEPVEPDTWKKAICRYCGTGCGTEIGVQGGRVVAIRGNRDYPVNKGALCLKGLSLMYVLYSGERATRPYIKRNGEFREASMGEALDLVASRIRETVEKHGPDAVAIYAGAQLFTEELYLANKLFKGLIGTNNVESNARLCMASAVTGYVTTFGLDEPSGGYSDIDACDCFFIIGSNLAEAHPVIFARVLRRKAENPRFKLIVADPRFTPTAAHADIWLPFYPGTDLALMNAMAHVIVRDGLEDENFIRRHTRFIEGGGPWGPERELTFDEFKKFLSDYAPEKVAEKTGVAAGAIEEAAHTFGEARASMTFWTMGLNQRRWGTWSNNLAHNLHLLTGKICRPGSTPLSMTGQPNACGGVREQGFLSHALPSHRLVKSEKDRREMERIWGIPEGSISPKPGPDTLKLFDDLGKGKIKLLWIVCSNPAQTMPDLHKYLPDMKDVFLIVQDIFPPTQTQLEKFPHLTAELADVFLPSAFWIEKGGVFGNTERRSSLTEKVINPPGNLKSDGEIFMEVAKRLGYGKHFTYRNNEDVWDEYRRASRGTDMDLWGAGYEYLREKGSAQWPILHGKEGGTPIRYRYPEDKYLKDLVDSGDVEIGDDGIFFYGFPDGKAKIFKRPQTDPAEVPDGEYPFYFTTGRVVHHWHTGTMTMRVPWLKKMVNDAFLEIHADDARRLGIEDNDLARITSRRGSLVLNARVLEPERTTIKGVTGRVSIPRPGVLFAPFFDANKLVNLVTTDACDDMSRQPEYKICAVKLERVRRQR